MAPKDKQTPPAKAKSAAQAPARPASAPPSSAASPAGERIAKVLSRRGIASRREAERLIEAGEVSVNGKVIESPALNVTDRDRITVSGQPLPEREEARLWLYYKPEGLVTSAADEKGRDTVFDHLPEDLPRVMSVGRLDLNSEGLLLLTNDGALKRRLELPSTGWLRKYRVRVNGAADDVRLQPLRDGITVEGEHFKPMQVTLDRVQGANAWLTVGLREGRNREIRRAMSAVGLYVNRLIRVSYGPFRLGELQPGEVEEVKARILRDQLGEAGETEPAESPRPRSTRPTTRVRSRSGSALDSARSDGTKLARPVRAGDGVKTLSRAWKEATTATGPRGEKPTAARGAAKPARGPQGEAGPARPAGGKTFGTRAATAKPDGVKSSGFKTAGFKTAGFKSASSKSAGTRDAEGAPRGKPAPKPATKPRGPAKPGRPPRSRS